MLSSPYMVKQLIDKQSSIFSDRAPSYIADNLVMHGDHLMFMGPDKRWRQGRKLYHQYFNEGVCEKRHLIVQNAEATQMLRDFYLAPEDLMYHPKRFTNSLIMSLSQFNPFRFVRKRRFNLYLYLSIGNPHSHSICFPYDRAVQSDGRYFRGIRSGSDTSR